MHVTMKHNQNSDRKMEIEPIKTSWIGVISQLPRPRSWIRLFFLDRHGRLVRLVAAGSTKETSDAEQAENKRQPNR